MIDFQPTFSNVAASWESVTSPLDRLPDAEAYANDPLGISHQPP